MWNTADMAEHLRDAPDYGFSIPGGEPSFDWTSLKKKRDAYIHRLNGIYDKNLEKDHCDYLSANATFLGPNKIKVDYIDGSGSQTITGKHICIAVGGKPNFPEDVKGSKLGIDSDGFFELEKQPRRVGIVGAGYIAVEFAGIFNALGSETHLFIRNENFLRTFDPMIQQVLLDEYKKRGVKIHAMYKNTKEGVEKLSDGSLKFWYDDVDGPGSSVELDTLVWAIGRVPLTKELALDKVGVKTKPNGMVIVDDYQNTSTEGIYAIGDVTGKWELTPGISLPPRRLKFAFRG
jgi:glutathione reductase (NADPH)